MNGWKLGLMVARSVDQGVGQGRRQGQQSSGKISLRAFAVKSGHSPQTINKYLITWNTAAKDGLVPFSEELFPNEKVLFDSRHTSELWLKYLGKYEGEFALDERHTSELWDEYFKGGNSKRVVYFIGHKNRPDLPIKIGKSKTLGDRISSLQCGNPLELEILFTVPGYSKEENQLHKLFKDKRISNSEWFNLTIEDLEWVRSEFH